MTDEALSLKIAEFLEPEPTMDSKCWVLRWPMYSSSGVLPKDWRRPRNMVTDPAMTVMLTEDAYFLSLKSRINGDAKQYQATFLKGVVSKPFVCESDWDLSIGRAVAEAFARAKGLI